MCILDDVKTKSSTRDSIKSKDIQKTPNITKEQLNKGKSPMDILKNNDKQGGNTKVDSKDVSKAKEQLFGNKDKSNKDVVKTGDNTNKEDKRNNRDDIEKRDKASIKQEFPNQLPKDLDEDMRTAKELGVRPIKVSDPSFENIVNSGKIKWAVTKDEEILIIPKQVKKDEIYHSVISEGQPVLAAGEANISSFGGTSIGLEIDTHSGHFLNGVDEETNERVLEIGKNAFKNEGIEFI